jgi:hypothetical protein
MVSLEEENKTSFMVCVELVLMKRGNSNYVLVLARLKSLYNCEIVDCADHPEYLRTVLKEVYEADYNSVIDDISLESDRLVDIDKFKAGFFKVLTS